MYIILFFVVYIIFLSVILNIIHLESYRILFYDLKLQGW